MVQNSFCLLHCFNFNFLSLVSAVQAQIAVKEKKINKPPNYAFIVNLTEMQMLISDVIFFFSFPATDEGLLPSMRCTACFCVVSTRAYCKLSLV